MGVKVRSLLVWATAACALTVAVLYGLLVYSTLREDPVSLLACYNADTAPVAWTCGQVLRRASLSAEQVRELNARAGAHYPLQLDPSKAEEMLELFLARGVDINAQSTEMDSGWTALHILAGGPDPEPVRLLLKHGARTDIRDARGKTAVERAREGQRRDPNPRQAEIVRMLEEAERKEADQK